MASVKWYSIGKTNDLMSSKVPYFVSEFSVENEVPFVFVSNTSGEGGEQAQAEGFVRYKGVNLKVIPNGVYVERLERYALRDIDGQLQIGVKHD